MMGPRVTTLLRPGTLKPMDLTLRCQKCGHIYPSIGNHKGCPACGRGAADIIAGKVTMWWEQLGYKNPPPIGELDDGTGHDPRLPKPRPRIMVKLRRRDNMAKAAKAGVKTSAGGGKVLKMKKGTSATGATTKAGGTAKAAKKGPENSKFIGRTTGMRVQAFQDKLMKENYRAKLTDAQLAQAMREEFPNAVKFTEAHVAGIRSQFNNGRRPSQEGQAPAKPLAKFDEEGNAVNPRARAEKSEAADKGKAKKVKNAGKKAAAPVEDEEEEDVEDEEEEEEDEDLDEDEE